MPQHGNAMTAVPRGGAGGQCAALLADDVLDAPPLRYRLRQFAFALRF